MSKIGIPKRFYCPKCFAHDSDVGKLRIQYYFCRKCGNEFSPEDTGRIFSNGNDRVKKPKGRPKGMADVYIRRI